MFNKVETSHFVMTCFFYVFLFLDKLFLELVLEYVYENLFRFIIDSKYIFNVYFSFDF